MSWTDKIPGVDGVDWERVNKNLRCPICGEKAHIRAETNGSQGYHTHNFEISHQMALELSKPSEDEKKELLEKAHKLVLEAGVSWADLEKLWKR